jgi:alpha,alpha-trehalase
MPASPDEAEKFFDFIAHSAMSHLQQGHEMQTIYGISREHDLSERPLSHLKGWRRSKPVRIGNAVWRQKQLDAYGSLLLASGQFSKQVETFSPTIKHFLSQLADKASEDWKKKDHGIWEIRGEPKHSLYSKIMGWVGLDNAIHLAKALNSENKLEAWQKSKKELKSIILEKGWNSDLQSFTQSFDSDILDASNLIIPIVGFLPADDPKVLSTLQAIEKELTDSRGLVFRYRSEDGLKGEEGSFLLCTFWLAQAYALAGRLERAKAIVAKAMEHQNDLGLFSEEIASDGQFLGNFPQAFSHIGLINAIWNISQAG